MHQTAAHRPSPTPTRPRAAWLVALGLLASAAPATAQTAPPVGTTRSGFVPTVMPESSPAAALSLPAPPRSLAAALPKHSMPEVPFAAGPELPPGRPTEPGDPARAPAGGVVVYRNTPVRVGTRSYVGEPSCAHNGPYGIQTGNWYAATTDDDGQSWDYVNPATKFPASDGGFCCDQYTLYVPHVNAGLVVWMLQYSYSATTQTNRLRLAFMRGSNVGSATVSCYVDLTPSLSGYPAGTWFDFPHMAYSEHFLFVTSNVFNAAGQYQGAAVFRLDLADIGACRSVQFWSHVPPTGSNRFGHKSQPLPDMFFFAHATSASTRVYRWRDVDAAPTFVDVPVSQWYGGTTPVAGPDGRSFTDRSDNRIRGAWDDSVHVGCMWYSNQGGSYPRPHVRVAWFDRNTLALAGETAIWHGSVAWAYPSVSPNSYGHLGGSIAFGGGTFYPGTAAWIVDDRNCWGGFDNLVVASGTHGPAEPKWGDYYSTQADTLQPGTWLTTAMALNGGTAGSDLVPRNVDFGRSDVPITYANLRVRAAGVAGVAVTIDRTDNFCRVGGIANFDRWYRAGAVVGLSVPGAFNRRSFYRWRIDGVDQPLGMTAVSVTVASARVAEAIYGDVNPGWVIPFGSGCAGSNGTLTLTTDREFETGQVTECKLLNAARSSSAAVFLGVSRTNWNGVPLPLALPPSPCQVYTDMTVSFGGATNSAGAYVANVSVPNVPSLIGGRLYAQALAVDLFVANPFRITTSNALDLRVGGWIF